MPKMIDITGQRFGYLVALEPVQLGRHSRWRCICDCGRVVIRQTVNLKRKHIKRQTCGCVNGTFRHGYAGRGKARHPLYRTWSSMHNRCHSPNDSSYSDYGGRGIKVCERWNDFANFIADIGNRPPGHSLDRIDNDGNYEPNNIRWATPREQIKNRRIFQALGNFSTEELKAELQKRGAL